MTTYVIYFNAADYPNQYVVRKFEGITPDINPISVTNSLKEARETLPDGLYHIERCPNDDIQIVETWI